MSALETRPPYNFSFLCTLEIVLIVENLLLIRQYIERIIDVYILLRLLRG